MHLERLEREKAARDAWSEAWERETEIAQRQTARRVFKEQERKRRPYLVRALAAQWEEAARLRAFLDTLEANYKGKPPASVKEWLEAARSDIADLDPLSPGRLQALRFHADAVAHGPEDDAPRHPDESYWFDEDEMEDLVDELFGDRRMPLGDVFADK